MSAGIIKRQFAIAATLVFIWLLWSIPYTTIRQERIRAYGEKITTGYVTGVFQPAPGETTHRISYEYRDNSGITYVTEAPMQLPFWEKSKRGMRIKVYYATGMPSLSRVQGQQETALQKILGSLLRRPHK